MKLLIVDDSLSIRRKVQRCAEASYQNISIMTASDGQQAIEIFKQEMPDVVTMDLTMPNIGGVECIKELVDIKPDVHILVVSALSDKVTALTAIKNGAEGFLKKPFTDGEMHVALDELLSMEEGQHGH